MSSLPTLHVGIKTDPIEYRFSFEWLFRLLAEESVRYVQLGTFAEIYHLPDEFFISLRKRAEDFGLSILSVFTSHRELGGFFRNDPHFEEVTRRNYKRLIDVGVLVGANSVGSSAGATLRDEMETKEKSIRRYLDSMKELMQYAYQRGLATLTIEPMSCLAEPPTLPHEMRDMADELLAYHRDHPDTTSSVGYCVDVSHGYADRNGVVLCSNMELLEAALPYTIELHLRNTDAIFESTFGFTEAERKSGIVDIKAVRDMLVLNADLLPVDELVGYLEIGGPKTGRDYSDCQLEDNIRVSLRYLREVFSTDSIAAEAGSAFRAERVGRASRSTTDRDGRPTQNNNPVGRRVVSQACRPVLVAPSVMCADLCRLEESVRRLEAANADILHFDVADAHFVPNILLGLDIIRQLRKKTALPFDVHLMVDDANLFIDDLIQIGVEYISVHAESSRHLDRVLSRIREAGIKAGVALNPATAVTALSYVLERLDFVVLMTVNPGFAGQKLIPSAFRKIADCCAFLSEHGSDLLIEVDGNVSFENIPEMVAAGADILVAGSSSLFREGGSLAENSRQMEDAIAHGLDMRAQR